MSKVSIKCIITSESLIPGYKYANMSKSRALVYPIAIILVYSLYNSLST